MTSCSALPNGQSLIGSVHFTAFVSELSLNRKDTKEAERRARAGWTKTTDE